MTCHYIGSTGGHYTIAFLINSKPSWFYEYYITVVFDVINVFIPNINWLQSYFTLLTLQQPWGTQQSGDSLLGLFYPMQLAFFLFVLKKTKTHFYTVEKRDSTNNIHGWFILEVHFGSCSNYSSFFENDPVKWSENLGSFEVDSLTQLKIDCWS